MEVAVVGEGDLEPQQLQARSGMLMIVWPGTSGLIAPAVHSKPYTMYHIPYIITMACVQHTPRLGAWMWGCPGAGSHSGSRCANRSDARRAELDRSSQQSAWCEAAVAGGATAPVMSQSMQQTWTIIQCDLALVTPHFGPGGGGGGSAIAIAEQVPGEAG